MNTLLFWSTQLLGLGVEPKDLTFYQISLRGIVVFVAALVMVRVSDRRALSKKSPFDIILIVVLASVLSRAINGSASFFATIGGSAVLVALHRLLAFISARSTGFTALIKGHPAVLVRNGQWQHANLRQQDISTNDVIEDMRLSAKVEELEQVKVARLEMSGDISFILTEKKG
jgi:uncharacterized membrane protein YcaP (DUF421 family)